MSEVRAMQPCAKRVDIEKCRKLSIHVLTKICLDAADNEPSEASENVGVLNGIVRRTLFSRSFFRLYHEIDIVSNVLR